MRFLNVSLLFLLIALLSACSEQGESSLSPDVGGGGLYNIHLSVEGMQQADITVEGIPSLREGDDISPVQVARIFVYDASGKEVLFDDEGNPSDDGERILIRKGEATTRFQLLEGKYDFIAQAEDEEEHRLAWGRLEYVVEDDAELNLPLQAVIGGIRFSSSFDMDNPIPEELPLNTPIIIYAQVYPEGRQDLLLPTDDYIIEYTVEGSAKKLGESTMGVRIALSCGSGKVKISASGLIAQEGQIVEGDLGALEFTIDPLDFCNELVDANKPWLSLDYHQYQQGNIILTGEALDLQQGLDIIRVYDGIELLGEATLQRDVQPHRWEYTFSLPVRKALQLRIVAQDKAGNQSTVTRNIYPGQTRCEGEVQIPDNKLELIMRHALELPLEIQGALPATDIERLEVLSNDKISIDSHNHVLAAGTIQDLTGLQCATNLIKLGLTGTFSDLSSLAQLKHLRELRLYSDKITDLSPLQPLIQLTSLTHLGNSSLVDINPITALTSLQHLNLSRNSITDISALSGLEDLRTLILYQNEIEDMSVISELEQVQFLWLSNNEIQTLPDLSALDGLQHIFIDGNRIQDITPLTTSSLDVGNVVNLRNNPLNEDAAAVITLLREQGVEVIY